MRLFIAINFDDTTKDRILDVQDELRDLGRGRFVGPDNLHLTLAFLGEVDPSRVGAVKNAMDQCQVHPMTLHFGRLGCFNRSRRDGELWWLGIDENKTLSGLQRKLTYELKKAGFKVDEKKFKPHITLARQMNLGRIETGSIVGEGFSTEVSSMSLMLSERGDRGMIYTELYRR